MDGCMDGEREGESVISGCSLLSVELSLTLPFIMLFNIPWFLILSVSLFISVHVWVMTSISFLNAELKIVQL